MMTAQAIDDVLVGTFPASDPPSWTPGIARPAPANPARHHDSAPAQAAANVFRVDVIDLSRPPDAERTSAEALVSLTGAVALALLVPFVIVAIGAPLALGMRGALEVAEWILAFIG